MGGLEELHCIFIGHLLNPACIPDFNISTFQHKSSVYYHCFGCSNGLGYWVRKVGYMLDKVSKYHL